MDPFGAMAVVFFQETVRGQSKWDLGESKCFGLPTLRLCIFFYCDEQNLILDNSKYGIWCVLET